MIRVVRRSWEGRHQVCFLSMSLSYLCFNFSISRGHLAVGKQQCGAQADRLCHGFQAERKVSKASADPMGTVLKYQENEGRTWKHYQNSSWVWSCSMMISSACCVPSEGSMGDAQEADRQLMIWCLWLMSTLEVFWNVWARFVEYLDWAACVG